MREKAFLGVAAASPPQPPYRAFFPLPASCGGEGTEWSGALMRLITHGCQGQGLEKGACFW